MPAAHRRPEDGGPPVVLFDGVCNLCSATVRVVIAHERRPLLHFASLQSDVARELLECRNLSRDEFDSIVLIDDEGAHLRSDAALRIARYLKAPWSWATALRLVPRPVRDWCYDRIAASRYRIFGTTDACQLPGPEIRDRFLDADER